jgi:hypothetical protein
MVFFILPSVLQSTLFCINTAITKNITSNKISDVYMYVFSTAEERQFL